MVRDSIMRTPTLEEAKDFVNVMDKSWMKKNFRTLYTEKLLRAEEEFIFYKRIPYCARCARVALDKETIRLLELAREESKGEMATVKFKTKLNFDNYGGFDKFAYVGDRDVMDEVVIDGMRRKICTGKYKVFICRTCNRSIDTDCSVDNEGRKRYDQIKQQGKKRLKMQFLFTELDKITDEKRRKSLGEPSLPEDEAKKK